MQGKNCILYFICTPQQIDKYLYNKRKVHTKEQTWLKVKYSQSKNEWTVLKNIIVIVHSSYNIQAPGQMKESID